MLLTIITINYNDFLGLNKTIESVLSQTFKDYEWILIDGGSSDGSKALIDHYKDKFSYWCSEPDCGIYNAMNKGIAHAKGKYLCFMNSGDCFFHDDTLETVFNTKRNSDILYGDCLFVFNDHSEVRSRPDKITLSFLESSSLYHQASFIKRLLFVDTLYDENFRIVSDWKQWVIWMLQNRTFEYLGITICSFDANGISNNNKALDEKERKEVWNDVVPAGIRTDITKLRFFLNQVDWNPELSQVYGLIHKRRIYRNIINMLLRGLQQFENIIQLLK